jgi:hypothetical protein
MSSTYRRLYGVEYRNEDDGSTYEIFSTRAQAEAFATSVQFPEHVFVAKFDSKSIWQEDGQWNYDDNASTRTDVQILTVYVSDASIPQMIRW